MARRTFAENTVLLATFAAHVEALSPEAWQRLRSNCRPLAGSTPEALFVRAQLMALSNDVFSGAHEELALARGITTLARAFMLGVGMTFEVLSSAFPPTDGLPRPRLTPMKKPEFDRLVDAMYTIEHAMDRNGARIQSVRTAVLAAANAVMHREDLPPAAFQRAYEWVESEIPYDTVDPSVADVQHTGN